MSYFTAAMSFSGGTWHSYDLSVDEFSSAEELTAAIASQAPRESTVLALIEHEDEWFGVVSAVNDNEPQAFVSDIHAVAESSYAELLQDALDNANVIDLTVHDDEPEERSEPVADVAMTDVLTSAPAITRTQWGGEPSALASLGVGPEQMLSVVETFESDPSAMVAALGESLGISDLVEGLR